jgi:hypothetical protein
MHLTLKQLITLLILVGVPATAGTVLYSGIVLPDNWVFLGGSPSNYPPAEPGALMCEPLKAAVGVAGATRLPRATLH